jgi:SAM-dependent methyltransferase
VRELYRSRFRDADQTRRQELWEVVVDVLLSPWVPAHGTVVDLGAGRCEFLHAVRCERKVAVDLNPEVHEHAGSRIEVLLAPSSRLDALESESVDVVFASNFFEHLPDAAELLATLAEVRRLLKPEGTLLVLQPNARLVGGAFWDFLDHTLPLTERSLAEAFAMSGLRVVEQRIRCLPYTTVGRRLPPPWLLRVYLRLPPAQWLFGKQSFIVVTPE